MVGKQILHLGRWPQLHMSLAILPSTPVSQKISVLKATWLSKTPTKVLRKSWADADQSWCGDYCMTQSSVYDEHKRAELI